MEIRILADMTQVTEEGYKGKNTKSIISVLFDHTETKGVGIIWMDEFDKKLIPSYTGRGRTLYTHHQAGHD